MLVGARWYSLELRRWLSRDPIEYDGGDNLYAYVNANPVGWVDPSGEAAIAIGPIITYGPLIVAGGWAIIEGIKDLLNNNSNVTDSIEQFPIDPSNNDAQNGVGIKPPDTTIPGRAIDDQGVVDWYQQDDGECRKAQKGPSGKPIVHDTLHGGKKGAREAATRAGANKPIHHPNPTRGNPHYHPTDKTGKKIPGKHFSYPKSKK